MEIRGWGEKVIFSYSNWRSKDLLGHEYFPFQRGFKSTDWSGQGLHGGCKCCRWVMWRRMKKTHPCSSFAAFCVEWWKYWSQLLKRNKRWGFDSCTSRMMRVDRAVRTHAAFCRIMDSCPQNNYWKKKRSVASWWKMLSCFRFASTSEGSVLMTAAPPSLLLPVCWLWGRWENRSKRLFLCIFSSSD